MGFTVPCSTSGRGQEGIQESELMMMRSMPVCLPSTCVGDQGTR